MQSIRNALRTARPVQNAPREIIRNSTPQATAARADRLIVMRERAVLATLDNDRADLLQQLHSHLGSRAFADTLSHMKAPRQVDALRLLPTDKRAAVFRELSTAQRAIWHQACKAEAMRDESLRNKLLAPLRAQWQRLRRNNGKTGA